MTLRVRSARPDDWLIVETLNRASRRALPKLWWWDEYLMEDVFVVVEQARAVVGALFAWPDESPVAWVRLASLQDGIDVDEWFRVALPPVLDGLRRRGARSLAWMDYWGWAAPCLSGRGFVPLTDVETLANSKALLIQGNVTLLHVCRAVIRGSHSRLLAFDLEREPLLRDLAVARAHALLPGEKLRELKFEARNPAVKQEDEYD